MRCEFSGVDMVLSCDVWLKSLTLFRLWCYECAGWQGEGIIEFESQTKNVWDVEPPHYISHGHCVSCTRRRYCSRDTFTNTWLCRINNGCASKNSFSYIIARPFPLFNVGKGALRRSQRDVREVRLAWSMSFHLKDVYRYKLKVHSAGSSRVGWFIPSTVRIGFCTFMMLHLARAVSLETRVAYQGQIHVCIESFMVRTEFWKARHRPDCHCVHACVAPVLFLPSGRRSWWDMWLSGGRVARYEFEWQNHSHHIVNVQSTLHSTLTSMWKIQVFIQFQLQTSVQSPSIRL